MCGAETGLLWLKHGDELRCEAEVRQQDGLHVYLGDTSPAREKTLFSISARRQAPYFNDDLLSLMAGGDAEEKSQRAGVRSVVTLALFHDGEWIGNINLGRFEVRPFDEKQAAILQAFADQAAIAVANAKLFNDLDAALERQTAMTDVLEAVGTARLDIQPVLDRVVDHAQRLCEDVTAAVTLRELDVFIAAAAGPANWAPDFDNTARKDPGRNTTTGELYATGRPIHIRDWNLEPPERFADSAARKWGHRSLLSLPLRRQDEIIGAFSFGREAAGGFSDSEVSLLQAFTDQASIAVNNAWLLHEIGERNAELSESLELQTATSDILRLISAHPGDLSTVLHGIAVRAAALCDAEGGTVLLRHGDILRIEAENEPLDGAPSLMGREFVAERTINRRARDSREPVFLDDFQDVRDPVGLEVARDLPNLHSFASIALLLEDEWIGSLNLSRTDVRPFDPKVAPVMQAFADQAAIAVANAKLFNDLDAALERQTAMTDVLEAVSTSRSDLQPVFDRIVDHAQRLCKDVFAYVALPDANVSVVAAAGPLIPGGDAFENRSVPLDMNSTTGAVHATGEAIHIRDVHELPADRFPNTRARQMGARSLLVLPMGRHGEVIGSIGFMRNEPGGFSDDEMSLLKAFTDQAAIAVANARLLREIEERNADLSESLELQTATSEVLQLISSNPGELTVVLEGIITRAAALCDAETGLLWLKHGDELRCEAEVRGQDVSFVGDAWDARSANFFTLSALSKKPIFTDDFLAVWEEEVPEKHIRSGVQSLVTIPLFHEDTWIGNINLGRREVRPFDQKQATILQAFADQAAIAVANAKLFNDLDAALERQTAMTEVLDAVSQARLDLQPVFDMVAHHADRLCHGIRRARRRP